MTASILVYHRIVEGVAASFHDVRRVDFLAHLDALERLGATAASGPILRLPDGRGVILSFDDGTADHAWASERLTERGWRGVFFVSPALLGAPGYLTEAQIAAMAEAGHLIGAHGFRHERLDRVPDATLRDLIMEAADSLSAMIGKPVRWFAPPGGICPPHLPPLLAEAGFEAIRTMQWGHAAEPLTGLLPALPVTSRTGPKGIARLLGRSAAWLGLSYRLKQIVRGLVGENGAEWLRGWLRASPTGPNATARPDNPDCKDRHALFFHILRRAAQEGAPMAAVDGLGAYPKLSGRDGDTVVGIRPWRQWLTFLDRCLAGTGWDRGMTIRRGHLLMVFLFRQDGAAGDPDQTLQLDMERAVSCRGLAMGRTGPLVAHAERHHDVLFLRAEDGAWLRRAEGGRWGWRDAVSALLLRPDLVLRVVIWKFHDAVANYLRPPGIFWSISGPDGAGKSTILEAMPDLLERQIGRAVSLFHTRPFLLGGGKESETTAGAGRPVRQAHAIMPSLMRLGWAWLDYWIGYWFRVRPLQAQGHIVLFDRHVLDYRVDPGIRGIDLPDSLLRLLRWTPRPNGQVLVLAAPDTLLRRKGELTTDEAARQIARYRAMASPHALILDTDTLSIEDAARRFAQALRDGGRR